MEDFFITASQVKYHFYRLSPIIYELFLNYNYKTNYDAKSTFTRNPVITDIYHAL